MKNKQPTHGGSRPGSGRKSKYGEVTVAVVFKVPLSRAPLFREWAKGVLKGWEKK